MAENMTIPTREEIEALPRWARIALAGRCARRILPLFKPNWPTAPAEHLAVLDSAVSMAEQAASNTTYGVGCTTGTPGNATAAPAYSQYVAASRIVDACRIARASHKAASAASAASAAARAVFGAGRNGGKRGGLTGATEVVFHTAQAAPHALLAIRFDFDTLRERAAIETWTDDTPVPPTVFGPMWPFGPPKDWPQENAGDRLAVTLAPPPDATPEQIAGFQIRLYEALNKLAIANGGAGLKVDSLGREVPMIVPAGKGE